MTTIDGDPEETWRRTGLTRYARRSLIPPALVKALHSTLEEVESRSRELLAKGTAARFVDKAGDSGEVVKLVERLREGITNYQVSESCFVALSTTHRWTPDITTASDLRSDHQHHCEHFWFVSALC